jgi:hypothetical protein
MATRLAVLLIPLAQLQPDHPALYRLAHDRRLANQYRGMVDRVELALY